MLAAPRGVANIFLVALQHDQYCPTFTPRSNDSSVQHLLHGDKRPNRQKCMVELL
jgi:hypothetical protein